LQNSHVFGYLDCVSIVKYLEGLDLFDKIHNVLEYFYMFILDNLIIIMDKLNIILNNLNIILDTIKAMWNNFKPSYTLTWNNFKLVNFDIQDNLIIFFNELRLGMKGLLLILDDILRVFFNEENLYIILDKFKIVLNNSKVMLDNLEIMLGNLIIILNYLTDILNNWNLWDMDNLDINDDMSLCSFNEIFDEEMVNEEIFITYNLYDCCNRDSTIITYNEDLFLLPLIWIIIGLLIVLCTFIIIKGIMILTMDNTNPNQHPNPEPTSEPKGKNPEDINLEDKNSEGMNPEGKNPEDINLEPKGKGKDLIPDGKPKWLCGPDGKHIMPGPYGWGEDLPQGPLRPYPGRIMEPKGPGKVVDWPHPRKRR
jgi:hypothetical protein